MGRRPRTGKYMSQVSPFHIFQDLRANSGNPKGALVMVLFRIAHLLRRSIITFILFLPYFIWYRITVEWFMGIELPWKTRIGPGFRIDHGQGLIVNDHTVFGSRCNVRNNTTIGNRQLKDGTYSASPIFGDQVDIGANAVIIGPVRIGHRVRIGAGAVVLKDVPDDHIAVGNPARIIPSERHARP